MIEKLTRASMSTILNKVNEIVDQVNALLSLEGQRVEARDIITNDFPIIIGDETGFVMERDILEEDDIDEPAEALAAQIENGFAELDEMDDSIDEIDEPVEADEPSQGGWHIKHRGRGKWDVITPEGKRFNENGISKDEAQTLVQVMDRKVA